MAFKVNIPEINALKVCGKDIIEGVPFVFTSDPNQIFVKLTIRNGYCDIIIKGESPLLSPDGTLSTCYNSSCYSITYLGHDVEVTITPESPQSINTSKPTESMITH